MANTEVDSGAPFAVSIANVYGPGAATGETVLPVSQYEYHWIPALTGKTPGTAWNYNNAWQLVKFAPEPAELSGVITNGVVKRIRSIASGALPTNSFVMMEFIALGSGTGGWALGLTLNGTAVNNNANPIFTIFNSSYNNAKVRFYIPTTYTAISTSTRGVGTHASNTPTGCTALLAGTISRTAALPSSSYTSLAITATSTNADAVLMVADLAIWRLRRARAG